MIMAREKTTMWSTCRVCKNQVEMKVYVEDVTAWENGELIQNAMPYLTPDEREVLISGTCGPCFDRMFGEDPVGDAETDYNIEVVEGEEE